MILKNLEVNNFRNIEHVYFEPSEFLTVISGQNGQGKTNLLEAVWLLSGAKSFRGSKDNELIKMGEDFATINSDITCNGEDKNIRLYIGSSKLEKSGRFGKIDGGETLRASSLAGVFYAVCFAPIHLSLVKGSPNIRRKFIDGALCQLYPNYVKTIHRYARLIVQKNSLLKDMKNKEILGAMEMLDTFDDEIVKFGGEIIERRKKYISDIFEEVKDTYCKISNNSEIFGMEYISQSENSDEFKKLLLKQRNFDLRQGYSSIGPHRDDLKFILDNNDAKLFASQGQQRSIALSLKLSEAKYIKQTTGFQPVMLMDDVLSELDSTRQDYLLNRIDGVQVIVTGCDSNLFLREGRKIYTMKKGVISE